MNTEQTSPAASIESIYKKGFEDINFYASILIPHVMRKPFPPYYCEIHLLLLKALLDKNDREIKRIFRLAIGLPRGFIKTTFMKVIACWLLDYDFGTFGLMVCATEPLAENFLSDVDDMLSGDQHQQIYGRWTANKAVDNKKEKTAMFRNRPVVLMAVGAGTAVRGLNLKHRRPDFILCDDMQTKENDDSETERTRLFEWFVGTLLKLVSEVYAIVIYLGNMYSEECILNKLRNNPYWFSLITGCILNDKQSLWPEVHPLEALYEGFKHDESLGLAAIWFAEMMNDPVSARLSLLPEGLIPQCEFTEDFMVPDYGFITIDPAGFKEMSDDNVIVGSFIIDSKPVVMKIDAGQYDPEQVILRTFAMCLELNISVVGVEGGAYQSTLAFWFQKYMPKYHMEHLLIIELASHGRSKEQRIRSWIKLVLSGAYQIFDLDSRQRVVWQAAQYKLGKKKNKDDILDACAYGEDMINEHWAEVTSRELKNLRTIEAQVVANNTPF